MEGKFSGEGIHSLESDDDMMSAMARELVERGNVGDSAAAVWADLKRERAQHVPSMPMVSQTEPGEEDDPSLPLLPLWELSITNRRSYGQQSYTSDSISRGN